MFALVLSLALAQAQLTPADIAQIKADAAAYGNVKAAKIADLRQELAAAQLRVAHAQGDVDRLLKEIAEAKK